MRITLRADVAEELLQDLFIRLAKSGSFRNSGDSVAYVFRSAMNLAFDWRRRQDRSPATAPMVSEPECDDVLPIAGLIQREELDRILNALGDLSPISRDVVVLHYLQQHSYADIAQRLGKSAHQVRGLCSKALTRLRSILASAEP